MEKHEAAKRGMSGEKKGEQGRESAKTKKAKVHRMEIERADGGGYIVHHHHEQPKDKEGMSEHRPMTKHVVADADDLADHVQEHMGDQPAAGEAPEPEPEQAPAPAAGGGDAMMGAGQ